MKILLFVALVISLISCKKNNCQSVTEIANYSNGTSVQSDTIFKNKMICGDELEAEKAKNGKKLPGTNVYITVFSK